MKKVLFILLGILCAVSAGAVSYASPYRGSGRGVIYTMSSSHNSAASAGLAQAPVATMGSVSRGAGSSRSRGVSSTMGSISVAMPVVVAPSRGIYTAATAVSGGVTTYDSGAGHRHKGGVRKSGGDTPIWSDNPGYCSTCVYDEFGTCIYCKHSVYDELEEGHCGECEGGCCCTPLDFNWGAMVFLMLLAVGYGVRASMREKCTMKENENRA